MIKGMVTAGESETQLNRITKTRQSKQTQSNIQGTQNKSETIQGKHTCERTKYKGLDIRGWNTGRIN